MNSIDTDWLSDDELRKAVALFYDGTNAPSVTAQGIGDKAQEIIDTAIAHEVSASVIMARLVELLMTLELGDHIPESLYIAIAHIIAFAYHLQGKAPDLET